MGRVLNYHKYLYLLICGYNFKNTLDNLTFLVVDTQLCKRLCQSVCLSVRLSARPSVYNAQVKKQKKSVLDPCLGSGPKGRCLVGQGGNFETSVHPSFRPSVHPSFCPPLGHGSLSFGPNFGPLSPHISLFRPQSSSRELKSALQTSYLPSRPQISPPDFKSALQASNLTLRPQASNLASNLALNLTLRPQASS